MFIEKFFLILFFFLLFESHLDVKIYGKVVKFPRNMRRRMGDLVLNSIYIYFIYEC